MKGYEKLDDVLARAFNQASQGKGAERHATEAPFHEQPMQQVNAMVGVGFSNGQAIKKIVESLNMAPEKAVHELLGAICYLAGSIITIEAANDNQTMQPDIKNAMHEYLDENFQLQMVDELDYMLGNFPKKWIKVPEGACALTEAGGTLLFWNDKSYVLNPLHELDVKFRINGTAKTIPEYLKRCGGGRVLWSRNPLPLNRDQAREKLSMMTRGEIVEINGFNINFGKHGAFDVRREGDFGGHYSSSLKSTLNYIFPEAK